MYIKVNQNNEIEKYPYSIQDMKKDNPNVSFPHPPSAELLAQYGVYRVYQTEHPPHNPLTQRVVSSPPQRLGGVWNEIWSLEFFTEAEAAENIRTKRNGLLSECDWTQLADASAASVPWSNYRQALRDIPAQSGFPFQVIWPNKPE